MSLFPLTLLEISLDQLRTEFWDECVRIGRKKLDAQPGRHSACGYAMFLFVHVFTQLTEFCENESSV